MGVRFRKTAKVAPGVKISVGKSSAGISFGNKYGGISANTKTGAHTRASIPGTGISYTSKISSKGKEYSTSSEELKPIKISPKYRLLFLAIFVISLIASMVFIYLGFGAIPCLVPAIISGVFIVLFIATFSKT